MQFCQPLAQFWQPVSLNEGAHCDQPVTPELRRCIHLEEEPCITESSPPVLATARVGGDEGQP